MTTDEEAQAISDMAKGIRKERHQEWEKLGADVKMCPHCYATNEIQNKTCVNCNRRLGFISLKKYSI